MKLKQKEKADTLTQQYVRNMLVYKEGTGSFVYRFNGAKAGFKRDSGYISVSLEGVHYKAHRLVWLYVVGRLPDEIDHINGIRDDNRIVNLREVSRQENARNLSKGCGNTSGVIGVSYVKKKGVYRAYITHNYKQIHLGYFKKLSDAAVAREEAEVNYGYHENHGK